MSKPKKSQKARKNNIWIYGKHACYAAINNPKRHIHTILVTQNGYKELEALNIQHQLHSICPVKIVASSIIEQSVGQNATHQGIAIECLPLQQPSLSSLLGDKKDQKSQILLLDQITDPHNIGAILRSAAAFNIQAVITTKHHAPQETGTLAKTACGALETIPVITVTNIRQTLDELKKHDYWCIGLDGYADQTINQINLKQYSNIVLLLGAEGKGLRKLTRQECDILIKLPISNQVESLNVSNAAAIACYCLNEDT